MATNTISDLNSIMFNELRKLEKLDASNPDAVQMELSKAKAMSDIAGNVIKVAAVSLQAAAFKSESRLANNSMPEVLRICQ